MNPEPYSWSNAPKVTEPAGKPPATVTSWTIGTIVFIGALVLYTITMARSVGWWDSGELIANAHILGIPHRPGFPLYILLARIFSLSPLGDVFTRINFFSAICGAAALGLFAFASIRLLSRSVKQQWPVLSVGFLGAVAILTTYSVWIQAVRAEVYALNLLIVCVLYTLLVTASVSDAKSGGIRTRNIYAAAFLFGLGLGGHHATLLSTAPAFVILIWSLLGRRFWRPGFLLIFTSMIFLGLSIYLYLPLRAALSPTLAWGWSDSSLGPGAETVLAFDAFSYLANISLPVVFSKMRQSMQLIGVTLGWPVIVLALVGFAINFGRAWRWVVFSLLLILGNLLCVGILATEFIEWNADLHGYLLPSILAFTIGILFGLHFFLHRGTGLLDRVMRGSYIRTAAKTGLAAIAVTFAVTPTMLAWPLCDLSDNFLARDLGQETLVNVPHKSVIMIDNTNWNFVLRGLQLAAEVRPDVAIVNRGLLPAPWYRHQCHRRYPELVEAVELPDTTAPAQLLQWADRVQNAGWKVYWQFTERDLPHFRRFRPEGHLYRLAMPDSAIADSILRQQEYFEEASRFYSATEILKKDMDGQGVYIQNLYRAGLFYERWGLLTRAREVYKRALAVNPREATVLAALFQLEIKRAQQITQSDDSSGDNGER